MRHAYKAIYKDPGYGNFCKNSGSSIFSIMLNFISLLLLLVAARQSVSQLTSAQKKLLLDLHNDARRNVRSPSAAKMAEMVNRVFAYPEISHKIPAYCCTVATSFNARVVIKSVKTLI